MNRMNQEAIVCGRVQGVAYRAYCMQCARELGVSGSAQNLPDGSVRVLASAVPEVMRAFWALLQEGPPMARVDSLRITDFPSAINTERFEIVY